MQVAELFARLSLKPDVRSWDAGDRLISGVKKALAGLVAFKTAQWFTSLIGDTAKAADHFAKLSAKIGIAIEPLQQLGYAAELSDVSIDDLGGALQKFALLMDGARRGGKEQNATLRALGPAVKAAIKAGQPLEGVLGEIAERFATMPDGSRKTALAMRTFGKSGAQLIPFLNEGRDGIAKLREEFVALGAQIDGPTAKAFEELNDTQTRIKVAWTGIKNQLAIALLPALQRTATRVLEWVKANRELIATRVREYAAKLVVLAGQLWRVMRQLISVFQWFVDHPGVVKTLLGIALAIKAIGVARSVISSVRDLTAVVMSLAGKAGMAIVKMRGMGAASAATIEAIAAATNKAAGKTATATETVLGATDTKLTTLIGKYALLTGGILAAAGAMTYFGVEYNRNFTGFLESLGLKGAAEHFRGGSGETSDFDSLVSDLQKKQGLSKGQATKAARSMLGVTGSTEDFRRRQKLSYAGGASPVGTLRADVEGDRTRRDLTRHGYSPGSGMVNMERTAERTAFDLSRDTQRTLYPGVSPQTFNMGDTTVVVNAGAAGDPQEVARIARDEVIRQNEIAARKLMSTLGQ